MFEFDPDKSAANFAKHGIDFDTAQALWSDDWRLVVDTRFVAEQRQLVIGRIGERVWTAVITTRGEAIRIISVRRSRDDEVKAYDSQDH
ncbi:BrnT family toxin [Phenylobacterium sp.]|uniref:BrnT family toxin n=1 Tax=Phenylobacterium sp. TaxID=1871053 RepID=UPI002CDE9F19|nr:BrnT family toxin [Phenylobacterium sp.]HLZ77421.1 BrnT family toxin [Phenylobacterium sp.]